MDVALARVRSAVNPSLTARIADFQDALAALRAVPRRPVVVAAVGLVPGAGRTTVSGLTALAAAAYADRRVIVVDTVVAHATGGRVDSTSPGGPHHGGWYAGTAGSGGTPAGRSHAAAAASRETTAAVGRTAARPPAAGMATDTVTELLGGEVADGRIRTLVDTPVRSGVPRGLIAQSVTPGTVAPVLSLPPGAGEFTPQVLEQALGRLRHRADLVVVDTPAGPGHPVLHAVLELADHFLLVVRGDRNAGAQIAAGCHWLASAPGRRRERPVSAVAVCRGLRPMPSPVGTDAPGVIVLARDEALRRRRLDRLSRRSAITGLRLATAASLAGSAG